MPLPSGVPTAQPGAPAFLVELATRVENYLAELITAEEARWVAVNPTLAVPFSEMRGLVLAGGKRLRPAFCYWGSIATGADPSDERIVRTGAALELLHAFALFHDDIMDGSLTRRGVETTHVRHSALHKAQSLDGDATRYGDGVALLVGDLTYVYADDLMADT
ncbi:MAG: polyprenyl synthetase family protein, partial [Actinomycetes bacterium]